MTESASASDASASVSRDAKRHDEWARALAEHGEQPALPAATVVLVRDGRAGLEVLMLRRNSKLAFGGMWVFPGGRIDDDDYDETRTVETAARRAAVREAVEEAGIAVDADRLVWFAHWTPPPVSPKRFATWFFLAPTSDEKVQIDGGEIHEHAWMAPAEALRRRDALEVELAPPTWVTLHYLCQFSDVSSALTEFSARQPRFYETHLGRLDGHVVTMWTGDAGYDSYDATLEGPKHRIEMYDHEYRFFDEAAPWV